MGTLQNIAHLDLLSRPLVFYLGIGTYALLLMTWVCRCCGWEWEGCDGSLAGCTTPSAWPLSVSLCS